MIDLGIGILLGSVLYFTRKPLLAYYALNPAASSLADQLIVIMSLVMVGMSYQMPVSFGIIRGGGDTRFVLGMDLISIWGIVLPLSFLISMVSMNPSVRV